MQRESKTREIKGKSKEQNKSEGKRGNQNENKRENQKHPPLSPINHGRF
jgi:hypothetical protein